MMAITPSERRKHGSRGGKIGGKISPSNFKNDPKLASSAGKKSKASSWPQCEVCGKKMSAAKMEKHKHKIEEVTGGV